VRCSRPPNSPGGRRDDESTVSGATQSLTLNQKLAEKETIQLRPLILAAEEL